MKNVRAFLVELIFVALLLGIGFTAGYYLCWKNNEMTGQIVEKDDDKFDLELPFEVERRKVTVNEVESKLIEIGELSTYSGEYTCTLGKDEIRYVLEKVPILGSKNSIKITCKGIVKVGYNLSDISVKVDDDKIYISVPDAQLNDNYIIWDSVECTESNSIFNPIEFSQYQEIIDEIEKRGLDDVTNRGIYQRAEENLKILIVVFLAEFYDYEIVFM